MLRRALIAVLLVSSCGQGSGPATAPDSRLRLGFSPGCGEDAQHCSFDLSCVSALSVRVWSEEAGEKKLCVTGDGLAGVRTGCDLAALDLELDTGAPGTAALVVMVEAFAGQAPDCAPAEDEPARLLLAGISEESEQGALIDVPLSCAAPCGELDGDGCGGVQCEHECCAGTCIDLDDGMLHCLECFSACDPFRSTVCDNDGCLCGTRPACGAAETCCDGACVPVGSCESPSCRWGIEGRCPDPASDPDACGGGPEADGCRSGEECIGGGCSCGGGPACPDAQSCEDGECS